MVRFASIFLLLAAAFMAQSQSTVLVYTHNGEGYVHENIPYSVEALKGIGVRLGIKIIVSDTPATFDELDSIKKFAAIIFANTNNEAFSSQEQRSNFQQYIQQGGGFIGIHSASASERDWPWYWAMVGGKFVYHPELQPFEIKVVDATHPSTRSLPAVWKWEDECYMLNELNPDIHILLAADLRTISDDKKEKLNRTFGDYVPLAWYHTFDGGRQFYTAIGHKPAHYKNPNYLKHLEGGIKWVLQLN